MTTIKHLRNGTMAEHCATHKVSFETSNTSHCQTHQARKKPLLSIQDSKNWIFETQKTILRNLNRAREWVLETPANHLEQHTPKTVYALYNCEDTLNVQNYPISTSKDTVAPKRHGIANHEFERCPISRFSEIVRHFFLHSRMTNTFRNRNLIYQCSP